MIISYPVRHIPYVIDCTSIGKGELCESYGSELIVSKNAYNQGQDAEKN